jgi:phage terminase large subunit-like protein
MSRTAIQEKVYMSSSATQSQFDIIKETTDALSKVRLNPDIFLTSEEAARELISEIKNGRKYTALVGPNGPQVRALAISVAEWLGPSAWYHVGKQLVQFPDGAGMRLFTFQNDLQLRGHNFELAWVHAPHLWNSDGWDLLMFCMRLGENPRVIVSAQ